MIRARWQEVPARRHVTVLEARVVAESPISVGSGASEGGCDQPVLRDREGVYLPGTSIAGVLQAEVRARRPAGLTEQQWDERVDALFGGSSEADTVPCSLVIDDARAIGSPAIHVRDHVRLEDESLVAMDQRKFDRESVDPGTEFEVRLEWWTHGPPHVERACDVLAGALGLLDGADDESLIAIGGRTRQGLGRIRTTPDDSERRWSVRTFDLTQGPDLARWLAQGAEPGERTHASAMEVAIALGTATPTLGQRPGTTVITLDMAVPGSLLVRGSPRGWADASAFRQRRGGREEIVIPGTSIRGALRHRLLAIAGTTASGDLLEYLFGLDAESAPDNDEPRAGRLTIDDAVHEGGAEQRVTRVAIDPWTGGALDHFLFTEDVPYGGALRLRFAVTRRGVEDGRRNAALGLLSLGLRDLWEGQLPLGGEGSVGRGGLRATGGQAVDVGDDGTVTRATLAFDAAGALIDTADAPFGRWVAAFLDWSSRRRGTT